MIRWRQDGPTIRSPGATTTLWAALFVAAVLGLIGLQVTMNRQKPASSMPVDAHRPPWIYGRRDARFTIVEYADLECPYCRAYFPVLRAWIDAHPEVNWQWHHRPLSIHEPAASREARLVECAGLVDGNDRFWEAAAWIYGHTRSDGQGLPADTVPPWASPTVQHCAETTVSAAHVHLDTDAASWKDIEATPTEWLIDHRTGATLLMPGAIDGDALLSAFDALAGHAAHDTPTHATTRAAR